MNEIFVLNNTREVHFSSYTNLLETFFRIHVFFYESGALRLGLYMTIK